MKAFIVSVSICFCFFSSEIFAQKYLGQLSQTEFHLSEKKLSFIVNVFETKKQLLDFLEIKKGDVAAEIGAADAVNIGILGAIYDSVTFYAQDIDAKTLTEHRLNKTVNFYAKRKQIKSPKQTNTFKLVIGTVNTSNLPNETFDEIFIIDSYHDFDKKDTMLDDIYAKLKQTGKLIIMDGSSFIGDTITCRKYGCHMFSLLDVEIKRCAKHGLYLTKMRNPNFFASNYGNALIYEKDKAKSDKYCALKNGIDPLAAQAYRLKKKEIASDSLVVKQIADSLFLKIKEITTVYPEFEVWLKDIAITHMWKFRYQAAINILKENVRFYPNSYQAYYWLGVAYQENKQYNLALQNFNSSLALNATNKVCIARIKVVEKKVKLQ